MPTPVSLRFCDLIKFELFSLEYFTEKFTKYLFCAKIL